MACLFGDLWISYSAPVPSVLSIGVIRTHRPCQTWSQKSPICLLLRTATAGSSGVFLLPMQNGQNGQGNGQDFLNILYIFSLSLPAELVTTRDETIGFHLWFFLHCAMKALLWTERKKITIDYDCRGCSNVAISGGPSASVFYIKDVGTRRTSLLQEKRLAPITRHVASLHCRKCV